MTAEQLKNSILKLAISGKLVMQDPNDEPASVLVEKIRKEKDKLVKEGKIKKEKSPSYIFRGEDGMPYEKIGDNEPVCIADEVPFEIPESWEWCRLKNMSQLLGGYAFKGNAYTNKGIRVIRISDFDNYGLLYNEYKCYTESSELENYEIYNNDILMCMTGGTVGKCCILNNINEKLYLNQRVADIRCVKLINQYYVYNVLISYFIQEIISSSKTSTNDNISMETIGDFLIPFPPLAEQCRIVSEIEKYLPLINEYDKLQTELDTLDKEFPEKLKKSILQEAIKGKLVEQDPSNEPASVLLDKIYKEKEKLIKEGKIKKDKNESIIYKRDNSYYEKLNGIEKCIDDEIPFEIPEGWEWCRLNSILYKLTDGTHKTPKYIDEGVPFLSVKDLSNGHIDLSNCKYISSKEHKELYKRCNPEYGDILLTKVGTTGIPVINNLKIEFSLFVSVALLKFNQQSLYNEFLLLLLTAPLVQLQAKKNTKGVGNKNWVMQDIANTLIVIPPYKTQFKIVNMCKTINSIINFIMTY